MYLKTYLVRYKRKYSLILKLKRIKIEVENIFRLKKVTLT